MESALTITSEPSAARMKEIVTELAAVKSRQDIDAALRIYHPDAELLSPPMGTRYQGEQALREGLVRFFRFAPDYQVRVASMAVEGDTLCAWGEIAFSPTYSRRGRLEHIRMIRTPVFILFRFCDEQVIWESFHFDLADLARQAGVPAEWFQPVEAAS